MYKRFLNSIILMVGISFLGILPSKAIAGDDKNISAKQLQEMLAQDHNTVLLDVRTEAEYNGALGHLEGSILIPLQELENRISELNQYKDQLIVIYCRSGNRSKIAQQILSEQNFKTVNLLGGMKAWNKLKPVGALVP